MKKILAVVFAVLAICVVYGLGFHNGANKIRCEGEEKAEVVPIIDMEAPENQGTVPAVGNYEYDILPEDGTVIILSYNGNESMVCVPNSIGGRTVSAIGEKAFYNNGSIEQVILPEGLTTIGREAFAYCTQLRDIIMGQEIRTIETYAFAYCASLKSVCFPEGLTEIKEVICPYCPLLEKIVIPRSMKSINNMAFHDCGNLKLIYGRSRYAEAYAQKTGKVYVDLDRIAEEGGLVW